MRTVLHVLIATFWLGIAGVTSAYADKKVALVVGNGAYRNVVDLPNPPNDAREVANSLRRLGFLVVEGIDLSHDAMLGKLREFSSALVGADVGLFFYAGHGLQVAGENYLVPIDAVLKGEADLDFAAIKVDVVVRQLLREAKIKVVVLDSCRDNPLAVVLARSMASNPQTRSRSGSVQAGMGTIDTQGASGTMIAFATAPGKVALDGDSRHSPFTQALLEHLETPDLDIDLMMKRVRGQVVRSTENKQEPYTTSSLTAEYFLNRRGGTVNQQVATSPPSLNSAMDAINQRLSSRPSTGSDSYGGNSSAGPGPAFDPRQMEIELWRSAQANNSIAEYNVYLQQFPNGAFAAMARTRVAALQPGTSAAKQGNPQGSGSRVGGVPAGTTAVIQSEALRGEASQGTEGTLNLGTSEWREAQMKLTALGYSTNGTDGRVGDGTRQAIKDWQISKKLAATGYFNGPQHQALLAEYTPSRPTADKDDDQPKRSRAKDDDDAKPRKPIVRQSRRESEPEPSRPRPKPTAAAEEKPAQGSSSQPSRKHLPTECPANATFRLGKTCYYVR